jgi:nitrite reductase/ring-hydroxylating ferredoxin subunit
VEVDMEQRVCPLTELEASGVTGAGKYAVGVAPGAPFAVTRRCRHLRADLAGGHVDDQGRLVCPWHASAYDVTTGEMVRGPQGVFAKIPGLGWGFKLLTKVLPLGRGTVTIREGDVFVE